MSGVGLAVGLYGAYSSNQASNNAANMQQGATNMSLAEMKRQFDLGQNNMAPWLRAGRSALSQQQALMGLGGDTAGANRALIESPNYKFALEQGNRSLAGSSAARGGMGSGKALAGAMEFGQNFATGQRANRLSELANLSGVGQNTAMGMGQSGQNYAQNYGNMLTGNANAQGAAGIAGANARQSGLLGAGQLGLNMYSYLHPNNNGNNWANNNNPNYNGPAFPSPY